jgi:hypothetical protein
LLGRKVLDADGQAAGRIEEVHARRAEDALVVEEYVLGAAGLIERFALGPLVRGLLGKRLFRERERHTVPWSDMDLSDPERPRLRRRRADIERIESAARARRRRRRRAG